MFQIVLLAVSSLSLAVVLSSPAMALDWDTIPGNSTADGGSGIWNLTTANWFDGASNTLWASGSAVFGGADERFATISVPSGGIQATSLTFKSRMTIAADEADGDLQDDMLLPIGIIPINGSQFARITAPIGGEGGIETFTQTWLFSSNTYSGGTHIRSLVNALSRSALGIGEVVLYSGNLSYSSAPFGVISNKFTFIGGDYVQFREGHTLTGEVVVQNSMSITPLRAFGQSGLTFAGPISGASSATLQIGDSFDSGPAATIRVTQNNPFTGTVRLGTGTLTSSGGVGFPNAKLTLAGFNGASPSTLTGNGIYGDVSVSGSSRIIPGEDVPGENGVGTLTIKSFGVNGAGLPKCQCARKH